MSAGKRDELKLRVVLRHWNLTACDAERFQIEGPSERAVGWRTWRRD
jgi:hypothetical protein